LRALPPKLPRVETVAIAIVVGVVALWLVVSRGGLSGARFTITVRGDGPSGVQVTGSVPACTTPDVADFIAGLGLPHGARVQGIPHGDHIELRCSSHVPEHLHQRLRNFLLLRR
jgi:hypothetical protein